MVKTFIIGGRVYEMQSPNVKNIVKANEILEELKSNDLKQSFGCKDEAELRKALSALCDGRYSFSKGTKEELVEALSVMYEDILANLRKLTDMSKNLSRLVAKQK